MTKIRRGGYEFQTWVGDHEPRHVHVYRAGELVARWNLATGRPWSGRVNRKIVRLIRELQAEGRL